MIAKEVEPLTTTSYWQLAFEPEYGHSVEGYVYAGYIFRGGEHVQRIDMMDEAMAQQLVAWLNEREDLLAGRQN